MIIDIHQDISVPLLDYGIDRFINPEMPYAKKLGTYSEHGILDQLNYKRLKRERYRIIVGASCPLKIGESGIYVPSSPYTELVRHLEAYKRLISKYHDKFQIIKNSQELKELKNSRIGIILAVEGIYFIKNNKDFKYIDRLQKYGVKVISPMWSIDNFLGGGANSYTGLTTIGKGLIEKLNAMEIIVDASHTNTYSLNDMLSISTKPIIMSHTLSGNVYKHPRNISDINLKKICRKGGLVGVCFIRNYCGSEDILYLVNHIKHMIKVGGNDHIAIGSDYGGMISDNLIKGLEYPDDITKLTDILLSAKLKSRVIEKLLWNNAYRFLLDNLNYS